MVPTSNKKGLQGAEGEEKEGKGVESGGDPRVFLNFPDNNLWYVFPLNIFHGNHYVNVKAMLTLFLTLTLTSG